MTEQINSEVWAYYTFAAIFFAAIFSSIIQRLSVIFVHLFTVLVMASAVAFPILPHFMSSYWTGMMVGFIGLLLIIHSGIEGSPDRSIAGAYSVLMMIFAMISVVSMLLHVI